MRGAFETKAEAGVTALSTDTVTVNKTYAKEGYNAGKYGEIANKNIQHNQTSSDCNT